MCNLQFRRCRGSRAAVFTAAVLAVISAAPAAAYSGVRYFLSDSIKQLSDDPRTHISRRALSKAEQAERLTFVVSLKMRNFENLQARLALGQAISPADLEANYLPPASEYADLQAWLVAQGFVVALEDPNHTNIYVSGTVAEIETSLGITFAKVAIQDGEFTSAITAPALPVEFSSAVLAISGLQPHLRMRSRAAITPQVVTEPDGSLYMVPSDVRAAYKTPATLTGSGQTIAVVYNATVLSSDLSAFYSAVGSSQVAGNVTTILVGGGPDGSGKALDTEEVTREVEWAGGMAPGAKVRLYAVNNLVFSSFLAGCSQILADAAANHITVVSLLFFDPESHYTASIVRSNSQVFAQMAAAGITVVAGSGDGGSNPNLDGTQGFSPSNPLQIGYPSSDPQVTAIGGTIMTFASGTFANLGETAWTRFPDTGPIPGDQSTDLASGGGISSFFARPAWQTDGGAILTGPNRCTPDVSVVCSEVFQSTNAPRFSALGIVNGQIKPGGAVSLATPIWGGIVALLNQARADAGLSPIGLLGPAIYPLHGTSAFNDITSGTNGAYSAAIGYDLVTGLGSPNIGALAAAVAGGGMTPVITEQPQSTAIAVGSSFSLSVPATGGGTLTYQWFQNGSAITGATSPTYAVGSATSGNAGAYTVVVSNASGSVTSSAATVTVIAVTTTAPASSSGGGGGGAPSYFFCIALAVLLAIRYFAWSRQGSLQRARSQ